MEQNSKINRQRRQLLAGAVGTALVAATAGLGVLRPAQAQNATAPLNVRRMIPANGYAFYDFSGKLRPLNFHRRPVGDHDVAIEIHYCGVCHSDIHTGLGHWGQQRMPQIPGHEIAGVVTAVGSKVSKFKVGDRVGVGCMVDSCGHCAECEGGNEQYCENMATFTYGTPTDEALNPGGFTQGGYSNCIVVQENFVLHIPDNMELSAAGPLMCAAVTVYSPFLHWNVGKGSKIAVVGLGGLGHMAVQIAKAMGAEVTVFTTSADKEADARRFGASDVVVNYDESKMAGLRRKFDFILATVPYQFDMNPLIHTLKRDATLCLVGIGRSDQPNQLAPFTTIVGRNRFAGSLIGSIKETQQVIDFCAEHRIAPQVTLIKPSEISRSWQEVVDKKARYRYVIDMKG